MDDISNEIENLNLNKELVNIFQNIDIESIGNFFNGNSIILIAICIVSAYLIILCIKKYMPIIGFLIFIIAIINLNLI